MTFVRIFLVNHVVSVEIQGHLPFFDSVELAFNRDSVKTIAKTIIFIKKINVIIFHVYIYM